MADELADLFARHAQEDATDPDDLSALFAKHASDAEQPTASKARVPSPEDLRQLEVWNKQSSDLPWHQRALQGVVDPMLGAGQVLQNIPGVGTALEKGREGLGRASHALTDAMMGESTPYEHEGTSTEQFNQLVSDREKNYQGQRKVAGQEGLDLTRIGGTMANPISWMGPARGTGTLLSSIRTGATQGAFQALLQPVTSPGNFLLEKGMQAGVGALTGGTLSSALHGLSPLFRRAKDALGRAFGSAEAPVQQAAASKIADDTLTAAGVDPAKVDPNLYGAIKQEVGDALKVGAEPNPKIIANRADAASLPVPIDLTRGQAGRDAMQYSWEVNNSKIAGAGEPLSTRLVAQNRQLIENLNQLGAKNAPSTYEASQALIQHLEGLDARANDAIDAAYSKVRDSAGRPALMDQDAFGAMSKDLLTDGRPELASLVSLADYLPPNIATQYNALLSGKLPLTVDTAQFLDRAWGGVQRGAADDTVKKAIGQLRTALNKAPVKDQLGAEAMAAYKAARGMAKERIDMMDANPAYKAVVDGVEPDKFFQKYVQGANVSEIGGLKQLIGPDNTSLLQKTLLGNLKKQALNRKSDENGVFSQSAYNQVLQDPVQMPRLQELFKDAPDTLWQMYRLGRVAENIQAYPMAHSVNTSNTAPTAANIISDVAKSEAGQSLWGAVGKMISPARAEILRGAAERNAQSKAVNAALSPGVTSVPLKAPAPSAQSSKLSALLSRGGAAAASSDDDE